MPHMVNAGLTQLSSSTRKRANSWRSGCLRFWQDDDTSLSAYLIYNLESTKEPVENPRPPTWGPDHLGRRETGQLPREEDIGLAPRLCG